eukprot:g4457.t1
MNNLNNKFRMKLNKMNKPRPLVLPYAYASVLVFCFVGVKKHTALAVTVNKQTQQEHMHRINAIPIKQLGGGHMRDVAPGPFRRTISMHANKLYSKILSDYVDKNNALPKQEQPPGQDAPDLSGDYSMPDEPNKLPAQVGGQARWEPSWWGAMANSVGKRRTRSCRR